MTGNKRNKTGSLSSADSGGNLHLSDVSDSLTSSDGGELHEQSDREFLKQQIKLLKIPFQLETDCPALSRIKGIQNINLIYMLLYLCTSFYFV